MSGLGFLLVLQLCVGSFFTFGFVRRQEVGDRYYLIHGLGAIFFSAGIYLWLGRDFLPPQGQIWLFVFWALGIAYCLRPWFPLYLGAATAGLLTVALSVFKHGSWAVVNSMLSTGLLGFSLMAMLLGHWYLTQPKLSIDELKRVTWGYLGLLAARSVFALISLGGTFSGRSEMELYKFILSSTPGVFLLMRLVWGILAPLGLSYFVYKTVSMRSTQSATGILYVVDLAVLTGETVSLYLMLNYGITA